MQRRERDLGRSGEEQPVGLECVDVRAVGREEAGAVHRLLADEDGRDHGREARLRQVVERELVERHRDPCRIAHDVAEARSGHARSSLHVEAADLRVLAGLGERRRLAHTAKLLGVVLRVAVGRRVVGRVRDERERRVSRRLGGRELLLGLLERCLDRAQRLQLLRRRLALQLRLRAELVDLGNERAPALVGGEERVEVAAPCARVLCASARRRLGPP